MKYHTINNITVEGVTNLSSKCNSGQTMKTINFLSHLHGLTQEHANKVYHDKECLEEVSGKYHTAGKSELIT